MVISLGKSNQITPNPVRDVAASSTDRCVKERQELYASFKSPLADDLGVFYVQSFCFTRKLWIQKLQLKSCGLESVNTGDHCDHCDLRDFCEKNSASSRECIRVCQPRLVTMMSTCLKVRGMYRVIGKNVFECLKARGNKGSGYLCHLCLTFESLNKIER